MSSSYDQVYSFALGIVLTMVAYLVYQGMIAFQVLKRQAYVNSLLTGLTLYTTSMGTIINGITQYENHRELIAGLQRAAAGVQGR
jgi:hypothetical protein